MECPNTYNFSLFLSFFCGVTYVRSHETPFNLMSASYACIHHSITLHTLSSSFSLPYPSASHTHTHTHTHLFIHSLSHPHSNTHPMCWGVPWSEPQHHLDTLRWGSSRRMGNTPMSCACGIVVKQLFHDIKLAQILYQGWFVSLKTTNTLYTKYKVQTIGISYFM